jgi:hypothetical protein
MKQKLLISFLFSGIILSINSFAQESQNNYVKQIVSGVTSKKVDVILPRIQKQDRAEIVKFLTELISNPSSEFANGASQGLTDFCKEIYTDASNNIFKRIDSEENIGIVFLYRNINDVSSNGMKIDFGSLNSIYLHKDRTTGKWTNYLLETKKVYVFMLDLEDDWYQLFESKNIDSKLSNSSIDIKYKTSFFKQSFEDLSSAYKLINGMGAPPAAQNKGSNYGFRLTMIEIDPKRVKAPCDIVVKNKSFKEDFKIAVHERNFVSFQVGLANNKFSANNFSIANNNLVVKPNDTQKEEWKSNLTALIAFHPFGRDIDNFNPIWKSLFARNSDIEEKNKRAAKWFYNNLFSRIGIYGGVKISKDPLSGLSAGFNYALTKEFSVNLGWTWTNEVIPQVTEIGNITSLPDALKYARRDYSKPKFSWGLTFAPSSVISMLGLKDKKEN